MTTRRPGSASAIHPHRAPNSVARALNRITSPGNGPGFTLKFHLWLYQTTDGRLGHGLIGAPTLLLTTTGRRTGQRRTTAVAYVPDHGCAVIGATNGGKGAPGWFYNLMADPHAHVQIGRQHLGATARPLAPDDAGYQSCWQQLNQVTHGRFAAYEAGLRAAIPLVVLEPERPPR